jgi:EmrB/QacA subfamily drug resistance transporter
MPERQGTKPMLKQVVHGNPESEAEGAMLTPSATWALASLSLSMLLSALGTSIANVALPTLAQALRASFQDVQWVVLAFLLAVTALVVSAGRLGDLVGRRRLLLAGIGLFTTASLFCGVAPTLWLLVAARAAQGLGAAVMMALTMAYVGATVPKAKTGSAMGLLGTMSAVGTALGPSLGGILISSFGWRAIFLVNVPLGVLAFLLSYHTLPGDKATRSEGAGFDWKGTLLLALTLAAYAMAMTVRGGIFSGLNLTLLAAAGLGAGLFVLVEARAASPLIRLGMFRNPVLSAGLAMSALVMTVMMATLVVGPFYLARGLGLDAAVVGLVMSAGPVVAALTGIPAGRLVDRFGAGRMTKVGLVAAAAGSFALSMIPAAFGIPGYVAPLVVITAGYALFQAANNTAAMTGVSQDQKGIVSGMLNLSRNLGLVTGASVMGAVFALASGAIDITTVPADAVATGMRLTFALAAGLVLAALAISASSRASATRPSLRLIEDRAGESRPIKVR